MHPDEYIRPMAKCACGERNWRADKWMNNRKTTPYGGMGCQCSGYWFPHRMGSLYCWYRADGTTRMPDDVDFYDREENYA